MVRNESPRYIISLNVWFLSTACIHTRHFHNKTDSPAETAYTSSFMSFYFADV